MVWTRHNDKKENKIFLICKEIQSGAVAKSYMRKGFLIYEKMRKFVVMRRPLVFATAPFWISLSMGKFFYIFLSVQYNYLIKPATSPLCCVCVPEVLSTLFITNLRCCVSCCCGCSGCSRGCCHHWYILTYDNRDKIWSNWAEDSHGRTRNPFQKCLWPNVLINIYIFVILYLYGYCPFIFKSSLGLNHKNEELSR